MSTTTPDLIRSPNPSDPYNLISDWGITTNDVQAALNKRANSYVGTSTQRVAFTTAPEGVRWQDTNGDRLEWVRIGGSWLLDSWHTSVTISITSSAGGTTPLTFPSGAFANPPIIQVSRGSSGTAKYIPYTNAVTATGATVGVFAGDGSSGSGVSVVNVSVFRK